MAIQTDYNANLAPMIAATIISRNVETEAGIGFGKAVAQGDADKGVVLVSATASDIVGITLLDRSAAGEGDTFRQGDSARVMTKGDVWVEAAVAVYVVPASGAFTNVSADNTAFEGARWDTSTTAAGQLAVIRLG